MAHLAKLSVKEGGADAAQRLHRYLTAGAKASIPAHEITVFHGVVVKERFDLGGFLTMCPDDEQRIQERGIPALEGSRGVTFGRGLSLTPRVEVGLRHDGGDAETGSGLDLGGGLLLVDPSTGLSADVRVRMLLVHEAAGFRDRGMSVSLSYNPTPSTPLGLTARVAARALVGRPPAGPAVV